MKTLKEVTETFNRIVRRYVMFDNDYTIFGKHAKFLKFLAKKNADSETFSAKIFERYIDVYLNAAVFGLMYSNAVPRDEDHSNSAHILAAAFLREHEHCVFLFRMIMLLDESTNLTDEEKINRAFRCDEHSEEFQNNLELFNSYVRGGIEIMYEKFTDGCRTQEDYLDRTYEVINSFQKELDGISDEDISQLINENSYF